MAIKWIGHLDEKGIGINTCYAYVDGIALRVNPYGDGFVASLVIGSPFEGHQSDSSWTCGQRFPCATQQEGKEIAEKAVAALRDRLNKLLGDGGDKK